MIAKCKWYDPERGYGFLSRDTGADIFVHASELKLSGLRELYEGQMVRCEVRHTPKGASAYNVEIGEAAG